MVTHCMTKSEQEREEGWARTTELLRRSRAMAARVAEDEASAAHKKETLFS